MDPSSAWLLTQGVLGFTTLALIGVVWRLWVALEVCRRENSLLQKEHSAAVLALHERTLTTLGATTSQMGDNTKAIQMVLDRRLP